MYGIQPADSANMSARYGDFLSDAPFENLVQNAQTYLLLYACAEGVVADLLGGRGVGLESYDTILDMSCCVESVKVRIISYGEES